MARAQTVRPVLVRRPEERASSVRPTIIRVPAPRLVRHAPADKLLRSVVPVAQIAHQDRFRHRPGRRAPIAPLVLKNPDLHALPVRPEKFQMVLVGLVRVARLV